MPRDTVISLVDKPHETISRYWPIQVIQWRIHIQHPKISVKGEVLFIQIHYHEYRKIEKSERLKFIEIRLVSSSYVIE